MNPRSKQIIRAVAALLTVLLALRTVSAIPLHPDIPQDHRLPAPHLYLPPGFLKSLNEERLHFSRMRIYREQFDKAVLRGDYRQGLAYCDSLIRESERLHFPGVQFVACYKHRADMLMRLGRKPEACTAYARALSVQDSLARLEQGEAIQEMQINYELDRLSLDQALLSARHHKHALLVLSLTLLATVAVLLFVLYSNRRSRRLRDELIRQTGQSRASEEKKADFIKSMCHEVRTPLNCIAGFSELLATEEPSAESRKQYCEIIQQSRRQLRYLFDDMLEVAYLENHPEPLERSYTDLCDLCRMQLRILRVRYPKTGVHYIADIPDDEIGLFTNVKYLTLLVSALLNNAYKFTSQGSITLQCAASPGRVTLTVTDTGCGIPEERHGYVFERFTKLDTFSQGNGLGLYLCRLIATRLGGEIGIDPAYRSGTRIVVTLPRE